MTTLYLSDDRLFEEWRRYPVRAVFGACDRCGEPTILVQSMDGGYITRNCSNCGRIHTPTERMFFGKLELWVVCPECRRKMEKARIYSNYGYDCSHCDIAL